MLLSVLRSSDVFLKCVKGRPSAHYGWARCWGRYSSSAVSNTWMSLNKCWGFRAQGPCLASVRCERQGGWAVACGVCAPFSTPLSKQWMTVSESAEFLVIGEQFYFAADLKSGLWKPRAGQRMSFLVPENLGEHRNTFLLFFWKWKETRKYSNGTFINLVSSIDPFKRKNHFPVFLVLWTCIIRFQYKSKDKSLCLVTPLWLWNQSKFGNGMQTNVQNSSHSNDHYFKVENRVLPWQRQEISVWYSVFLLLTLILRMRIISFESPSW